MKKYKYIYMKFRVLIALGVDNILRILLYRLGIIFRIHPVININACISSGYYYQMPDLFVDNIDCVKQWWDEGSLFGHIKIKISDNPPDWLANPITGKTFSFANRKWWLIPDFDPDAGDIKDIWELSRFEWVIPLAQRIKTGDTKALKRLNLWLTDWTRNNPPYLGPNWKCGQEASIRVIHLAAVAVVLQEKENISNALKDFIIAHLLRIKPTISYAIAQDNNHGTSEAAAMYIGGTWLDMLGHKEGSKWAKCGRYWLENRVLRLIDKDGGFSQHSVNYHRMMLDTICIVEVWRRFLGLCEFSEKYKKRVSAAVNWLASIVDKRTGDAPNFGANDGARILPLTNTNYRDYRPTVQLASVLFNGKRAYSVDGLYNNQLSWLGVKIPSDTIPEIGCCHFKGTGYAVLRNQDINVLIHYPRFRFRPGHADIFHVDLWCRGNNIFRDSGTFSYNTDKLWQDYFKGTQSHNTVQFDDRNQMPSISRFLFVDWLKSDEIYYNDENNAHLKFVAKYRDSFGASHKRSLLLSENCLTVCDEVAGFKNKAVLRWRLKPGKWVVTDDGITDGDSRINISSDVKSIKTVLSDGWESRYYNQKSKIPVLEAEINNPGIFITKYYWRQ